jgi:hypothetical protein
MKQAYFPAERRQNEPKPQEPWKICQKPVWKSFKYLFKNILNTYLRPERPDQTQTCSKNYKKCSKITLPLVYFLFLCKIHPKKTFSEFICGRWYSSTGDDLKNAFSRSTIQCFLLYNSPFLWLKVTNNK